MVLLGGSEVLAIAETERCPVAVGLGLGVAAHRSEARSTVGSPCGWVAWRGLSRRGAVG